MTKYTAFTYLNSVREPVFFEYNDKEVAGSRSNPRSISDLYRFHPQPAERIKWPVETHSRGNPITGILPHCLVFTEGAKAWRF